MTTEFKKFYLRRGTTAQWATANPILASGEIGYETTNKKFKIGDGTTVWSGLAYSVDLNLTFGTTAGTVTVGNDSRLTNSRPPNGTAGGDLAGTYPNPTIKPLSIVDGDVAVVNKDGLANVPSMRTLGTGAQQAAAGNDSRFVGVTGRAVSFSRIPEWANGEWNYNGSPFTQDNLTTANGVQYAVWWNADKKPFIGKRTLPAGVWTVYDLSTVAGNPLASPVPDDGHNCLAVAVDSDGYIHVTGNYHGNTLRYIRSTGPASPDFWTARTMVGTLETSITYPVFMMRPDNTLIFFYRDGASGDGDLICNKYNTGTGTWSRVGKIIDGKISSDSAYPNHFAMDANGDVHIFGCWRGTASADSNYDFFYFKLNNITGVATATRANGSAQTLPVTHANCDVIIDTDPTGSGLLNTHGADVDTLGRPHATTWLYDGDGNTQIQHVWYDGAIWHNDQVTHLTQRTDLQIGTIDLTLSRVQVVCAPSGETLIIYRCNYDGKGGTLRAIDVTPGKPRSEFILSRLELYEWEPCFDTRALRERNELHMLTIPLTGNGHVRSGVGRDCWITQLVGVLTINLDHINLVRAGVSPLPVVQQIRGTSGPDVGIQVTSLTSVALGTTGIIIPKEHGKIFFVRHSARMNSFAADVTLTLQVRSAREQPSSLITFIGSMSVLGTLATYKETPWMPLKDFGVEDFSGGFIQIYAYKTGGTLAGSLSVSTVEVGVLDTI